MRDSAGLKFGFSAGRGGGSVLDIDEPQYMQKLEPAGISLPH